MREEEGEEEGGEEGEEGEEGRRGKKGRKERRSGFCLLMASHVYFPLTGQQGWMSVLVSAELSLPGGILFSWSAEDCTSPWLLTFCHYTQH